MRSKRRSITTSLVAVIAILAIVLCLVIGMTYTAECSETQISDDAGIVTTSNTYEDFSSYTDQELPDKIDRSNIKQYVPVDKFNKNGTTVYNGRNYGFVIYSSANTNHVLLFKEIYTPHTDGGGYDVTLKVVYQNSFFKSGNNILNANSPYKISLSNVRFNNSLFDAQMSDNVVSGSYDYKADSGVYYIQSRYDNKLSYFNEQEAAKTVIKVGASIVSLAIAVAFPPASAVLAGAKVALASANLCLSVVNAEGKYWEETTSCGVALDFPLTREQQINTYGGLRKNMTLDMENGADEYLAKSDEYVTASLRVMNDKNKDYYVYNNISFDICRFSGIEHHNVTEDCSIESVYSVTGADCNKYSQVTEQDETFEYESYQRFAPMAKTNLFNFVPAQEGDYDIYVPNGYYLTIDGKAQSSNKVAVGSSGCKVGIAQSSGTSIGDTLYLRLLPQDFYNGEVAFTNISIQKDQKLNINEPTQVGEVAYTVESSGVTTNDVYILDAGGNDDLIDLYVTDGNLNVLAKAVKKDGKLYVNYPMKANEVYGVVCVNRTGTTMDLTVEKHGGMTVENYPYSDVAGLYYSYTPRYAQFYNAAGAMIYDENMYSYPSENAFLQANETYFLHSQSQGNMSMSLSEQTLFAYLTLGEEITTQNTFNEMFNYTPSLTALYKFADGSYDVYDGDTLVAQDVNQCVLQKDTTYLIVKRQFGGLIKVFLDGDALSAGENNINAASPHSVFKLNIEERSRLDININNSNSISIYDYALNEIQLDHGYLLEAGEYYVIVRDSGAYNITVEEYLQEVNITFYIDGEIYNDTTGAKYYYGKLANLPVPTKERYNFNGWKCNGALITDNNGVTQGELLADELTLVADWTLRGIIMEIRVGNGASKWWDGSNITTENPGSVLITGQVIDLLVNMKRDFVKISDGKKQGYFLETFEYQKTGAVNDVDYYEFTPVWQLEKYFIEFLPTYPQTYKTTRAVAYGETITSTVFPSQAFQLDQNQQLYYLIGWKLSENSSVLQFATGRALSDLTPGYGSEFNYDSNGDGEKDSTLVRLSAEVEYVDYTIRINSTSYGVPQGGYNIGALGSYGYTESNYYGHNVLLTTPRKDKLFSFGGVINISDLTSYWTSGSRSVTVDLSLVDNYITVALSYSHSGSGNPTSYIGSQGNVTLKSIYIRAYKFVNWTLDGSAITVLNYANLGVNRYYSEVSGITLSASLKATFTRTSITASSVKDYTISDECTYVDCSKYSLLTNMTFTIASSAKEVTFVNGYCTDTNIVVNSRNTKLVINFDSMYMMAARGDSVLDASHCPDLEIYSYDSVTLSAGEVSTKVGKAAILCQNLSLLGSNIYINGGDLILYGYYEGINQLYLCSATAGIKCESTGKTLHIGASHVKAKGGNGHNFEGYLPQYEQTETGATGLNGIGGCKGGDGAVAIYFPGNVVLSTGSKLTCTGGAGGDGGIGGKGGKGGPGRNGAVGVTTINPGDGGRGGNGGDGGDGGKAIVYSNFSGNRNDLDDNDGDGGLGGAPGKGGDPGDPVTTIWGNERTGIEGAAGTKGGEPGKKGASTLA